MTLTHIPNYANNITSSLFILFLLLCYLVVSVGYMDPGNWATDLAGGSSYGYMLLFVILMSNLMAVVLQGLAVKLGVVSGLGTYSLLLYNGCGSSCCL
jgi:NRAMP (natural resistance-associated macrophage protein)-like metal ion transporter